MHPEKVIIIIIFFFYAICHELGMAMGRETHKMAQAQPKKYRNQAYEDGPKGLGFTDFILAQHE